MKSGIRFLTFFILIPFFIAAQSADFKFNWEHIGEIKTQKIGVAGPITGIINEIILIGGGANFPDSSPWYGGKKVFYNEGEWFSESNHGNFLLPEKLGYAGVCSTPNGIIIAGGENEYGKTTKVWLTTFDRNKQEVFFEALPNLPLALSNLSLTFHNKTLYLAGGESDQGPFNGLLSLDLNSSKSEWTFLDTLPVAISHGILINQSNGEKNNLYLIGGRKVVTNQLPEFFSAVWMYDLTSSTWQKKSDLPIPLAAMTGLATGANYILVFGGDNGDIFKQSTATLQQLQKAPDSTLRAYWITQMENHPGFEKSIFQFNTITNTWTLLDTIPFKVPVTTGIVRKNNTYYLISGEISPGKRSPNIYTARLTGMPKMMILDYAVLIGYLLLMVVIGVVVSGKQSSVNDFFKGGQKIPGWAAGLSIYGTQLSAITFMSIPAKTYASNWNYFLLQMTIIMVMPFVAAYFIPFYRRLDITTAYEILEKRFNYLTRVLASTLFILLQLGRLGIVLLLPALALAIVTGMEVYWSILLMGGITILYTILGGIKAVIWTDVVQVIILLGGALICAFMMLYKLELNPMDLIATASEMGKFDILNFTLSWNHPTFWVVIIGGIAINIISYGTDQTVVQRYLTTKDIKTAKGSLRLGAWMVLPSSLVFFSIGTLLFFYFSAFPDKINPEISRQDAIFPFFIATTLPHGLIGLLIAAIFSAAMSTLSSSINSLTTAITNDFVLHFYPKKQEKFYLTLAKWLTLIIGILGVGIALYMAQSEIYSLWDQFNTILGLFTGGLGGLFILALFVKKANTYGVLTGIILSGFTQYYVKEYTQINFLLYAFTGLIACLVFGFLFSLFFNKKNLIS
jgi:solute:Na+ symporter, SSS family